MKTKDLIKLLYEIEDLNKHLALLEEESNCIIHFALEIVPNKPVKVNLYVRQKHISHRAEITDSISEIYYTVDDILEFLNDTVDYFYNVDFDDYNIDFKIITPF